MCCIYLISLLYSFCIIILSFLIFIFLVFVSLYNNIFFLFNFFFFFFKQKTVYEVPISDWSSDVCSSDLAPHDYGDDRNHHANVMTTTRVVDADGLGAKTRQLDVRSSASVEVEAIRERWAEQVNDALEQAQVAERVDHRSYARQGV